MPIHTLKILTDVYKTLKSGEQKLIQRNLEYKKTFETHGLSVEHYLNNRGIPSKKWCMIKEGETYYRVNHPFEYVEKLIKPTFISGYKRW
jgi:hypothetical protein